MLRRHVSRRAVPLFTGVSLAAACLATQGYAQTVSGVTVEAYRQTAPAEAVTTAPLDALQPTSVINQQFIENNISPVSNYDDIVKFSPSVNSVGPNGPGLMENQSLTIRGFQDGQYNLTIDGIAWGDSNDFTHHSTSYVMSHDLGSVSVDRGPGTAETLGDATFGGTISLNTKDPSDRQTATAYGSFGSFGTYLGGGELDTGAIDKLNGAKAMVDVEHLQSNGFLTDMGQNRTNVFAKVEAPVNANTTVTFAAMYNQIHQNVGLGATLPEMAQYGYNYALNGSPASQDYFGYNFDQISTDLAYIGVNTMVGPGILVDNKLYTYAYYHHGYNGLDPNGETPNGTFLGPNGANPQPNDVPGQLLYNDYESVGDVLRVSKDFGFAVAKAGMWYDHQNNHRHLTDVDDTQNPNFVNNYDVNGNTSYTDREQRNTLDTFQPYVEADIKPLPGLIITPGVRYDYFERSIQAPVNQGTLQPLYYDRSYDKLLPSVEVNYTFAKRWSLYAQYAQGFLAPNLNTLYTTAPQASSALKPQTTTNYQAGGVFKTDRLTLSVDVYYIDFGNEIQSRNVSGVGTVFYNAGGVTYKGVEGEGDLRVWGPINLYLNASDNSAKDKQQGYTIANSPRSTGAAGISYDAHGIYAALLTKYVGPRYGDNPDLYPLKAYTDGQVSLGYTIPRSGTRPELKIKGLIDNVFEQRGQDLLAGYTGALGTPLFWNIVPRNYEVSLSAAF
jgi:iron complex outermembrane receptor protein